MITGDHCRTADFPAYDIVQMAHIVSLCSIIYNDIIYVAAEIESSHVRFPPGLFSIKLRIR